MAPVGVAAAAAGSQVGAKGATAGTLTHQAVPQLGHEATSVLHHGAVGGGGGAPAGQGPSPAQLAVGGTTVAAVALAAIVAITVRSDPEPAAAPEEPPATTAPAPAPADPPTSGPTAFSTEATAALDGNLLTDAQGGLGPITVIEVEGSADGVGLPTTLPSGATVTIGADGSFTYDPAGAFDDLGADDIAEDTFSFTVTDGSDWSAAWTATIPLAGTNQAPTIEAVAPISIQAGSARSIELSWSDPDDQTTTIALGEPAPGFVTLADTAADTATLTVSPAPADVGVHTVPVVVTDSGSPALSDTTTLTITVTEVPLARVTDDLISLYHFTEGGGTSVDDSARGGAQADLVVADPAAVRWGDGWLAVDSPTIIRAGNGHDEMARRVTASNEVTVEAWVTPANATQAGPARIVSLSNGIGERNVTLAQGDPDGLGGDHWSGRIRSTDQSTNGLPAIATPAGTATAGEVTHLALTRASDGTTTLYIDGRVAATASTGGDLSNWDPTHTLSLANETSLDRPWLGTYHLVAVYGKALTTAEVNQNFRVGP